MALYLFPNMWALNLLHVALYLFPNMWALNLLHVDLCIFLYMWVLQQFRYIWLFRSLDTCGSLPLSIHVALYLFLYACGIS